MNQLLPGDLIVEFDEQAMAEISLLVLSVSEERDVTFILLGEDQPQDAVAVKKEYRVISRVCI